jgi:DNA polymerase III gamma/tau subunit
MSDYENDHFFEPATEECQDDRRPRAFGGIIGQDHIVPRLRQSLRNGGLPQLLAFVGPSGSGKTSLATVSARAGKCRHARDLGDCCGTCPICQLRDLNGLPSYHEWTGAELEQQPTWWMREGPGILDKPGYTLFVDEAQDLSKLRQKALFRQLERARANVILATTHKHEIVDALLNRFGANVFEVRRPSLQQAVGLMWRLCERLDVRADEEHLARAAQHYALDLRKCVDFVYSARGQAPDRNVNDEFLRSVLGVACDDAQLSRVTSRPLAL